MVGVSTQVAASRMEQLTKDRHSGFRGLLGATWYILASSSVAIIGSFLYGTDQGVLSNLLTGQNFGSKFPDVYSDPVLKGWVVSVLQLGAWLGALINGPLANKISRKYSITVAAFVCLSPLKEEVTLLLLTSDAVVHIGKRTLRRCSKCNISLRRPHYRRYCCRASFPCGASVPCRNIARGISRSSRLLPTARHQWV